MSDCPRFGKWFGGCKFAQRHDSVHSDIEDAEDFSPEQLAAVVSQVRYVRDVCVRCGKTVERNA